MPQMIMLLRGKTKAVRFAHWCMGGWSASPLMM